MEEAASAAAVSPATSEAGFGASTVYTVLEVSISSGLSQQLWSLIGFPTYFPIQELNAKEDL